MYRGFINEVNTKAANIMQPLQEGEKKEQDDNGDDSGGSKASEIIKELIKTSWGGSNDDQGKAVQLLKGLAFSDEDAANKFMDKLDKFTSGLNADEFS